VLLERILLVGECYGLVLLVKYISPHELKFNGDDVLFQRFVKFYKMLRSGGVSSDEST
jgi:hypothetical protein